MRGSDASCCYITSEVDRIQDRIVWHSCFLSLHLLLRRTQCLFHLLRSSFTTQDGEWIFVSSLATWFSLTAVAKALIQLQSRGHLKAL